MTQNLLDETWPVSEDFKRPSPAASSSVSMYSTGSIFVPMKPTLFGYDLNSLTTDQLDAIRKIASGETLNKPSSLKEKGERLTRKVDGETNE